MIFVVSRTVGTAHNSTIAITYGGGTLSNHGCRLSVTATTVASPLIATSLRSVLKHRGQSSLCGMQMLRTRGAPGDPQFTARARSPKERTRLIERRNQRDAGLSKHRQGVEPTLQHGGCGVGLHPPINRSGIDLTKIGGVDQIITCIERA